jgi:peptidyl-prolyl cis-trans isomerase SurA
MKKIYWFIALGFCSTGLTAQTLIHYGSNTISKEDFLRAYNKNKTTVEDKEKSIREYVDLYTNFKLKVKAADEMKLDTLPQIQFDVNNFRRQIIENYLSNEKGIDNLVYEAFDRLQKDKHVLHYSVSVPASADPGDTLRSYKALQELYTALKNNADQNTATSKAMAAGVRSGDLGFITAFTLPYEYENIIYGLKAHEVSKPYRSKNAWHIFKLVEERPSMGRWRIAQILIAVPEGSGPDVNMAAEKKAGQLYAQLKNGDNFGALAKENSNDRMTNLTGGELPEFGTGTYNSDFEKEVFALKNDGDISKPFKTAFGYHIIKRMGFRPTPSDRSDEVYITDLKQKILKDPRVNTEKEIFTREIIAKTGLKKTKEVNEKDLLRYADSLMQNPTEVQTKLYPISNKNILSFKNGSVKGSDWLAYVRESRSGTENAAATNKELWNKFYSYAAVNYYKDHLEEYNPDFKFQMQEFREGNMLFEIMERNVWSNASNDTAGLIKYYNSHNDNFKWSASADVLIFNCSTAKVAEEAMIALKKGKNWKVIASEAAGVLQADSGRYELSQITGANLATSPVKDTYTAIVTNIDGTATFVKYVKVYPTNQQRSFEDSRGLVINDYQQQLEQQWIAELRKKYPVKVNENMLKEIVK